MFKILFVLLHRFRKETRALSSAGSEHLPYKQRVGGSNPSAPTPFIRATFGIGIHNPNLRALSSAGSEHLPYKQRVGGSNPSAPTTIPIKLSFPYTRALSSAGSEHLPYKQRVGGSNPSAPTTRDCYFKQSLFYYPSLPPKRTTTAWGHPDFRTPGIFVFISLFTTLAPNSSDMHFKHTPGNSQPTCFSDIHAAKLLATHT